MPRTRNYRNDDSDDAIPIRRHTRKPKKQPVHWAVWLLLGLTGFFGLFLTITLVSCAGCVSTIRIPKDNATCIVCKKKFYISDEYRGNMSEMMVTKFCPRCGTEAPVFMLYDKPDPNSKSGGR